MTNKYDGTNNHNAENIKAIRHNGVTNDASTRPPNITLTSCDVEL